MWKSKKIPLSSRILHFFLFSVGQIWTSKNCKVKIHSHPSKIWPSIVPSLLFLAPKSLLLFLLFNLPTNTACVFDHNCFFNFQSFWTPSIAIPPLVLFVLKGISLLNIKFHCLLRQFSTLVVCFGEFFCVVLLRLGLWVREWWVLYLLWDHQ